MKNIIYKLGLLLVVFAFFGSCESPEADANYTPATGTYEYPQNISLATTNVTNGSFDITYTISDGEAYYVVVEGGSTPPSNSDVFSGDTEGLVASGNFALTENAITIDALCSDSSFDVYVVQFTSDSFLSPSTESVSVTTNSNSIAGTYDVVTNGVLSGNFGGETVTDFAGVATITDNGDGSFSFDDTTAGIYPAYYSAFAFIDPTFADPVPWTFDVECNDFGAAYWSTLQAFNDFLTFDAIINPDGTISVHWESAFGEVMDAVYTKQ